MLNYVWMKKKCFDHQYVMFSIAIHLFLKHLVKEVKINWVLKSAYMYL